MNCEQLLVLPPEILRPPGKNVYGLWTKLDISQVKNTWKI